MYFTWEKYQITYVSIPFTPNQICGHLFTNIYYNSSLFSTVPSKTFGSISFPWCKILLNFVVYTYYKG